MFGKDVARVGGNSGAVARNPEADARFAALIKAENPSGVSGGSVRAYGDDFRRYETWCREQGAPPIPATADQLGAYVHHLCSTPTETGDVRSPRSIDRAVAAVQRAHVEVGADRPDTRHARGFLARYEDRLARADHDAARARKAEAASLRNLRLMVDTIDRSALRGKRDAAVLLLGWAVLGRASETAAISFERVRRADGGLVVSVYRQKVKRWTDVQVPRMADRSVCPVTAFEELRAEMAAQGHDTGKIFRAVDSQGNVSANMGRPRHDGTPVDGSGISTATVTNIVARAAKAAGLADGSVRWSGHSLRRGGAQDRQKGGAKREQLEDVGGWSTGSRAVGEYLDGSVSMDAAAEMLGASQRQHCASCTCHLSARPTVLDADVVDAEIVN